VSETEPIGITNVRESLMAKPAYQSFVSNWDKTVSWAKSQHIPYQVYYPIYQQDMQKALTGTPMSEAERIRAIQAASGLSYSTALPTDAPSYSPTSLPSNIVHNAQSIFTGLEPQNLIANVFDTVKNTIEHPSSVYGIVYGSPPKGKSSMDWQTNVQNFQQHVLAPHSLLSWIPGFYDVAELFGGKQGVKTLAANPLTALLDVLPLGRVIPKTLAESEHGTAIAGRLGTTTDGLKKMDSIQLAYRLSKTLKLPGEKHPAFVLDAMGNLSDIRPMQIGERIAAYRNAANIGKAQGDLAMGVIVKSDQGTRSVERIAGPAVQAIDNLTREQAMMAFEAIQKDHRPIGDLLTDPNYPEQVRQAIEEVHKWGQTHKALMMQAGRLIEIENTLKDADGNLVTKTETYSTRPGSSGPIVLRAKNDSLAAQRDLDKSSKVFDTLVYKTQVNDAKMNGAFGAIDQLNTTVFGSIKNSDPALSGITFGIGQRHRDVLWNKVLETQNQTVRNLFGLPLKLDPASLRLFPSLVGRNLTAHHVNSLRDLISPGGLLDQMVKAQKEADWRGLVKYSRAAMRRWNNKVFDDIPKTGPMAHLWKMKQITKQIEAYALERRRDVNKMTQLWNGTKYGKTVGKLPARSIAALSKKAAQTHQHFLATAISHPPDVWSNTFFDTYVQEIMDNEESAAIVDEAANALIKKGMARSEVDKMRSDPRTIVELMQRSVQNSLENNEMPDIDLPLANELRKNAYDEIARLRAEGHEPVYVPLSPSELPKQLGYNVYLGSLTPQSVSASFDRLWTSTSSIYHVQAGILGATKDIIARDVLQEFRDEYVRPLLTHAGQANEQLVNGYLAEEIAQNVRDIQDTGVREKTTNTILHAQLKRMGYINYNPELEESIFGPLGQLKLGGDYYIHKDLASALEKNVKKFQFPAEGFWDRGTKLFRFSILGLSPRYTAHILVGGTALIAYRGNLSMLKQLRGGAHMFVTGKLPDDVLAKFPMAEEHMQTAAAQEGQADLVYHRATGYTMGNKAITEFLDNHQLARTMANWTVAAANINMRFTRAIVRGQRAIVYLDGAARAMKEGSFIDNTRIVPRLDDSGNHMIRPTTGQKLYDNIEERVDMTPEQAHHEGMMATADVMGELRHMTPLERSLFVRVFPFYGWTKHVLTYVLSYPIDHPYRATFLSQLATQNSADWASGLPQRMQLLMFLGHPDEFGNVKAVDARFMDPLRDTANYATWAGVFQSLNPILSTPLTQVDPQITFGANEVHPNLTYNALYGVKEAGPQGNVMSALEQFVPQLTAADAAFNLSGQYAYLKSQKGDAFTKKVFQSLNIPFFQIQHINLRQVAAQQEIDRYSIASNAAYEAASTGDLSYIQGYPANAQLPDPLNTEWNVTPAYIAAMTKASEQAYHLPFTETMKPPPNPPL
jgi:hypothetical protein